MTSVPFDIKVGIPDLPDLSHLKNIGPLPGIPDPYPSRRFEDYIETRGFLVPKKRTTPFRAVLRDPNEKDGIFLPRGGWIPPERVFAGDVSGRADIRSGVVRISKLEVDHPNITSHVLDRIPLGEIALRILALCSLTSEKDRHYEVVEPPEPYALTAQEILDFSTKVSDAATEARAIDAPQPVIGEPEPVLEGPDGRKWYRVRVVSEPSRALRNMKRTKMDEAFFAGVRAAYRKAREEGRSTTLAVSNWHQRRTGRKPAIPSVERYIRLAKKHYGEEF